MHEQLSKIFFINLDNAIISYSIQNVKQNILK